jgi:hypothetical protein
MSGHLRRSDVGVRLAIGGISGTTAECVADCVDETRGSVLFDDAGARVVRVR